MKYTDSQLLNEAVNNIAPKLVDGGRKLRGPNALFDFMLEVWIEKALMQTRLLHVTLENERQEYMKQKKLLEDIGHKAPHTGTYGWSKSREFKFDFSISPPVYQYFANIVGPFLGFGKDIWSDQNSRMWKRIKKMIIAGDQTRITKFAKDIERRLLRERSKKIAGAISGIKTENTVSSETTNPSDIQ